MNDECEAVIKHLLPAVTSRSVWWEWETEDQHIDRSWAFNTYDDAVSYGIELAIGQIRRFLRGGDDE
jgi:hypothetical protein